MRCYAQNKCWEKFGVFLFGFRWYSFFQVMEISYKKARSGIKERCKKVIG